MIEFEPYTARKTRDTCLATLWTLHLDGDIEDRSGLATGHLHERVAKRWRPPYPPSDLDVENGRSYGGHFSTILRMLEQGERIVAHRRLIERDIAGKKCHRIALAVDPVELPEPPDGFHLNGWPAHPTTPEPDPEPNPEPDDGHTLVIGVANVDESNSYAEQAALKANLAAALAASTDAIEREVEAIEREPEVVAVYDPAALFVAHDSTSVLDKLTLASSLLTAAMVQHALDPQPSSDDAHLAERLADALADNQRLRARVDELRRRVEVAEDSAQASRKVITGLRQTNAQLDANLQAMLKGDRLDDRSWNDLTRLVTSTPRSRG